MESITELKCDILLVCETWLTTAKNDVTASISDFGYKIQHVIRKNSAKIRGGGVGILRRTNIKPVRLNCGSYSSFEHCALYICCPKTAIRFNFIVLYRLLDIIGVARGGEAQGARAPPNQNTTNDKKL